MGTLRSVVQSLAGGITRVVLPEVCAGCGLSGTWMCPECLAACVRVDPSTCCTRCGQPLLDGSRCRRCRQWSPALGRVRSAYAFGGPVRTAIHLTKYRGEFARAQWIGDELGALLIELGWRASALVPVPLHKDRQRERGFNQSAHIAKHVSTHVSIPVADELTRIRPTARQVDLNGDERRTNVAGAFSGGSALANKVVILVDDVQTTGSTLNECAQACMSAGAVHVSALTLAIDL